ncbi:MAG: hypothetical protein U0T73_12345 [Chitinophagales bacterium]
MIKFRKLVYAFLLSSSAIQAQTYDADALRLSSPDLFGTARSIGAGGAFSSVGADPAAAASNPAGLAMYRSHEAAVSLGVGFGNSSTSYLSQTTISDFAKFSVPQASLVFASRSLRKAGTGMSFENGGSKLERVVFGISYNRLADYRTSVKFEGTNPYNSLAGAMANDIQTLIQTNKPISPDYTSIPNYLAWNTYVIDTFGTGSAYPLFFLPVKQTGTLTTQGSFSDINLTLGFNIADVVYVGAGVGIPIVSYTNTIDITESNTHDSTGYPTSYSSLFKYKMSSVGVNGKFGVIVKPSQYFRIGAAIQTPTYFKIQESSFGDLTNRFVDTTLEAQQDAFYAYSLTTPLRFTTGASVYFKQYGFLSVDYQLDDYTHAKFGSADGFFTPVNSTINTKYRPASTIKVGAEFAYSVLRVRAGFSWSQSPFKSGQGVTDYDNSRFNYTAGLGYRGKVFFADLAYVFSTYKSFYAPYTATTHQPGAFSRINNNLLMLTLGVKFGRKG